MGGKKSRNKGARGEREWAEFLKKRGFDAHRGRQYSGGPDSPDVVDSTPLHWEVKRTEKLSLYPALEQAADDALLTTELPAVAHRRNNKEWVVAMYASEFFDLLEKERERGRIDGYQDTVAARRVP